MWDARKLSLARRVTLAKVVLLAILNYLIWARLSCWWQSVMRLRNLFALSFEDLSPRLEGQLWWVGINVVDLEAWWSGLREQNEVLLLKAGFSLISKRETFWVQILDHNVMCIAPLSIHRSSCSYFWQSLAKLCNDFLLGLMWSTRNGKMVNLWNCSWLGGVGPLKNWYICNEPLREDTYVRYMVEPSGVWS